MTHRNSAGKNAVRMAIFRGDIDPYELEQAKQYVGPNNYLSLVWTDATHACLYVHDEVTEGGLLIACTDLAAPPKITGLEYDECAITLKVLDHGEEITHRLEVPELCLHAVDLSLDESEEQLCLVMSDGTQHCVDLTAMLGKYKDSYTVVQDPETKKFTFKKGDKAVISWWQGGFAEKKPDGSVVITNPDETKVTIPAPLDEQDIRIERDENGKICLVVDNEAKGCWFSGDRISHDPQSGKFTANKVDGTKIIWQAGDIISEDTAKNEYVATKLDGSQIRWRNAKASYDAAQSQLTIENADGTTVTVPIVTSVPESHPQTIVTKDGNSIKFTADHKGSAANVSWYMPKLNVVSDDAAELTVYDGNTPQRVVIQAQKDLVILNNPTFYIRKNGGQAKPPINSQADLTEENAFDSTNSMFAFIKKTYIFGTVTVDLAGTWTAGETSFKSDPAFFKNAQTIIWRAKDGNPNNWTIICGKDSTNHGFSAFNGGVTIDGLRVEFSNEYQGPSAKILACINNRNAELRIKNVIFAGNPQGIDQGAEMDKFCVYASGSGRTIFGTYNGDYSDRVEILLDNGCNMRTFVLAENGHTVQYSALTLKIQNDVNITRGVFETVTGAAQHFSGNFDGEIPFRFEGNGKFVTDNFCYNRRYGQLTGARVHTTNDILPVFPMQGARKYCVDLLSYAMKSGLEAERQSDPQYTII